MLRRALVAVAFAAVALLGVAPGPAQAGKPVEHSHFEGTDSFDETVCGLDVHFEVAFSGVATIRPVRDSDGQAFFGHSTVGFTETITLADPTSNAFVTTRGQFNFVEQHATHLSGDLWQFEASEAGTFTVRDSDGNTLIHDRGVAKFTAVFDTLGDSQPGGILLDEQVVLHGPHSTEEAFCAAFVGALT
ncbi:MAG: hypothetical protein ACRDWY_11075 [Actinomycetes bacterium]